LVASIAAGTSAQYYLSQAEYYLAGREPDGRWIAAGPGLGVTTSSVVERVGFERLHGGRGTDGRMLLANDGGRIDRVGGYDVTFSAPKSAALIWALSDEPTRRAIEKAQENAVAAAIRLLERDAAFCRRGRAGHAREPVKLTVASFRHGESRPAEHDDGRLFADPALHNHAVLLNIAQRADGTFGALDGQCLFAWKLAAGSFYHIEFARRLQKIGFAVETTGSNGIFEIAGVDEGLRRYFSARRTIIENNLAALGVERTADAPALAAAAARATRAAKRKAEATLEDRHTLWRERAEALGFAPERVIETARERGRQQAQELTPAAREALIRERVSAVPRALTETQSLFEHRHLVAAVAASLVGTGAGADRAEREVARMVASGEVVALGRDARWPHPVYSTPGIIAIERELLGLGQGLATWRVTDAPRGRRVDQLIKSADLNVEQAEAARLATGPQAISIIEGAPGVGKTTLLAPVAEVWREAGWRVIGAATAWKVAHALRDDLKIEAKAVDSWLAGVEHDRPFLTDRTVLLVDEAGLIGGRAMRRILGEVERARAAGLEVAVRLVGDRKQLQPIGGPGLRILADALGTQRVDQIVRQREAWARDVVTRFGEGRASEALALLETHGAVRDCAGPAEIARVMVEGWAEARAARPGQPAPVLIARTNAQVLALNVGVRARLRRDGMLAPQDAVVLKAVTPSGREHEFGLAVGDEVRFLARADEIGVVNGTQARVTRIERIGGAEGSAALRLTAQVGGREVSFAPKDLADDKGRVRFGHAYASTVYGAQGLTTETALVWVDAAMDRHDAFVAASRARGSTTLFVDRASLDARVRSERTLGDRKGAVEPEERREALAGALSRSGEKASTLDYLGGPVTRAPNVERTPYPDGLNASVRPERKKNRPEIDRGRARRSGRELGLDG
jgi:conjugative relaxase-like TrwC/TraI family protein